MGGTIPVIISFKARGTRLGAGGLTGPCEIMLSAGSRDEAYDKLHRMIKDDPVAIKMVWRIEALSVVSQPGSLPPEGFDVV